MAVETTTDLVSQLRDEIGFDVQGGDSTLLGWLNGRHRLMVARSLCHRRGWTISGGTVAGEPDYVLPSDVIIVTAVTLNGAPLDKARREDVVWARNSLAVFVGPNAVVAQGADGAGAESLTIYPAPDTAGLPIEGFGPVRAPELTTSGTIQNPVVPPEYFTALVHGSAAIGLRRTESRHAEAAEYQSEFDAATEELRRETRRRWGGPARIQIRWP